MRGDEGSWGGETHGSPGAHYLYRINMKTNPIKWALRLMIVLVAALCGLALIATGLIFRPRLSTLSRVQLILSTPVFALVAEILWRRARRH
jgi:hypothetical protein